MEPSRVSSCAESKRIAQSKCGNGNRTGLLTLPVEDIIYQEIFPKLSIRDLLNLYDADQSKYADLVYGFLPKVEVLDLSMPCRDPRVKLTPCTIPDHHLQGLKILNLKNCNWLSIGCLQTIGLHLRNLEKLDISRNGQICLDKKNIWCFARLTK
ncbi:F-box and leucine-rich repeat protein 15 [Nesidiocoris tenuis]|uniref:F-box and leucine-rich repeat protein 15 n=1 Tax=Nesidiocoris tenuis TaxID=355587 RepID=A0ABN7B8J0_9HEMI|nr:F-box and leucine-rich repeat protein 15 [Nesidiocoris tenuis]